MIYNDIFYIYRILSRILFHCCYSVSSFLTLRRSWFHPNFRTSWRFASLHEKLVHEYKTFRQEECNMAGPLGVHRWTCTATQKCGTLLHSHHSRDLILDYAASLVIGKHVGGFCPEYLPQLLQRADQESS